MTYKTHLSTGLLFSAVVFLLIYKINLSPTLAIILIFFTVLGSGTPDLDTPTGGLWDKIPAGGVLSRIIRPVFIGGHRHLSHSFIGMAIFSSLALLLIKLISKNAIIEVPIDLSLIAFLVGYLSHLIADMFTEAGVPLLFPLDYHFGIPPNPLEKVRIKTGKWFENLIIYPAVNLLLLWVIIFYVKSRV